MQIVVLGMHRSGTSAVARLLNLMGAYFGTENTGAGANEENEKGFWERLDVRALNDSILHNANCDWDRVADFDPDAISDDLLDTYRRAARDIVLNLDAHRPWFVKEPRLCVLFPVWRPLLELPFCVHVVRNPLEVAQSLKVRNGIPIKAGLALWEVYNKRAIASTSDLPRLFLSYTDLLTSPQPAAERLKDALAAHSNCAFRVPSQMELAASIDQQLYRQRSDEDNIPGTATKSQATLFKLMKGAIASNEIDLPPTTKACINALHRFEASGQHLAVRMRRNNARQRAASKDADPRFTLKSLELDRALANVEQRRTAMESKDRVISRMRTEAQDYKTQFALHKQRVEQLSAELKNAQESIRQQRRETDALTTAKHALEIRVAVKEQHVERLNAETRQIKANLTSRDRAMRDLQSTSRKAVNIPKGRASCSQHPKRH